MRNPIADPLLAATRCRRHGGVPAVHSNRSGIKTHRQSREPDPTPGKKSEELHNIAGASQIFEPKHRKFDKSHFRPRLGKAGRIHRAPP